MTPRGMAVSRRRGAREASCEFKAIQPVPGDHSREGLRAIPQRLAACAWAAATPAPGRTRNAADGR